MSAGLKAVFFDYGGTLDADGVAWKARFYALYRRFDVQVPVEAFDQAFYHADDSLVEEADPQLTLKVVLYEQVRRVLTELNRCDDRLVRDIAGTFLRDSLNQIRRNLAVLGKLAGHFRLGIISNNYGNLETICRQTGLAPCMQVLVDSALVGAVKPDPLIFQRALEQMSVRPEEAVMVGDSLPRDIRGARALGLRAVWLTPKKVLPPALSADPDIATIKTFSELPDILTPWVQAL